MRPTVQIPSALLIGYYAKPFEPSSRCRISERGQLSPISINLSNGQIHMVNPILEAKIPGKGEFNLFMVSFPFSIMAF